MGNLVRDQPRELGFRLRVQNQSCTEDQKTAGQGNRLKLLTIDNLNGNRQPEIGMARQTIRKRIDITRCGRVGEDRKSLSRVLSNRPVQRLLLGENVGYWQKASGITAKTIKNFITTSNILRLPEILVNA